jgi:hypothetical protein
MGMTFRLALLIIVFLAEPASAQIFSILSPRFSSFVEDDGNYTPRAPVVESNGAIPRDKLTEGLLYFSFGVQVTEETLKYLTAKRRLEVKCVIYANGYSEDAVEIGISLANWARLRAVITDSVKRNGVFNWRTYMNTEKIDVSSIAIVVKDGRGQTVRPSGFPGSYEARVSIQ